METMPIEEVFYLAQVGLTDMIDNLAAKCRQLEKEGRLSDENREMLLRLKTDNVRLAKARLRWVK